MDYDKIHSFVTSLLVQNLWSHFLSIPQGFFPFGKTYVSSATRSHETGTVNHRGTPTQQPSRAYNRQRRSSVCRGTGWVGHSGVQSSPSPCHGLAAHGPRCDIQHSSTRYSCSTRPTTSWWPPCAIFVRCALKIHIVSIFFTGFELVLIPSTVHVASLRLLLRMRPSPLSCILHERPFRLPASIRQLQPSFWTSFWKALSRLQLRSDV